MERGLVQGDKRGAEVSSLWFVAAALHFLLAAATIHLTSNGATIATVWPANAVLVALLLAGPLPRWKIVLSAGFVGNLAANWITRGTLSGPILYSVANGLEVVVAVLLIRADFGRLKRLNSTSRLLRFVVVAGFAAPFASGLLGAATAAAVYNQPFGDSLTTWLLSDGLGLLVFTPVFLSIFNGEIVDCFASKTVKHRAEALILFALTAVTAWIVFFVASLPALFILYGPVMLVTFRVGPLGTKMAVMIIAVIGAYATASGSGPVTMMTTDTEAQAHMFQASLAVMLLTCLPVAAEIAERARLATELMAREQRATEEAITDPLTGILNRRGFERAVSAALARSSLNLCCVAIDVDQFKTINDRWGHQFGDHVLQHLAVVLRGSVRPGDLIGRLGGDEFAIMLRISDQHPAEAICTRIQTTLRAAPVAPDAKTEVMVGISCGTAAVAAGDRFEDVYRRADAALYDAKILGGNAVRPAQMSA